MLWQIRALWRAVKHLEHLLVQIERTATELLRRIEALERHHHDTQEG